MLISISAPSVPSVVNPSYDDDGNMLTMTLASGSWTNTFNAENRIIVQEKSDVRLEYAYDYMGRRIEKKVYSGSTGNWTLNKHFSFVYDGYLQIEELDALNANAVLVQRIWSPATKGAGSEKYLAEIQDSSTYYALGDANKNISEYLNTTGVIQAHYEYSPFGKIVATSNVNFNSFNFRFSSEYFDSETGLIYYNYRYYISTLGRWLSRDPIGKDGGLNLYAFCQNDAANDIDRLGLAHTNATCHTQVWLENDTYCFSQSECSNSGQGAECAWSPCAPRGDLTP